MARNTTKTKGIARSIHILKYFGRKKMQPALQKCKDTSVFLHLTISCLTSGSHSCSHIETKTATYKELFATNPDKKFTWEVLFH